MVKRGVAVVVVAHAQGQCEIRLHLPLVLDEESHGGVSVAEDVLGRLSSQRIVGRAAFRIRLVLDQVQQAVKGEARPIVCWRKISPAVAFCELAANPDGVRSADPRHHVFPVVIVLREVAGPARTDARADSRNVDVRDAVRRIACAILAEDLAAAEAELVYQRRVERVGPVGLQREAVRIVGRCEPLANGRVLAIEVHTVVVHKQSVLAVAQVLVASNAVLQTVAEGTRCGRSCIDHWQSARQVSRRRGAARSGEKIRGILGDARGRHARRHGQRQNLRSQCVRESAFGPTQKLRALIGRAAVARRCGAPQGLHGGECKSLVFNNRAAEGG